MNKIKWFGVAILALSLAGNLAGLVVLDKAMHYREKIRFVEETFPNEGLRLVEPGLIRVAGIEDLGVFVGGGLARHWFLPANLPFAIANLSGMEESITTTAERFEENVIASGAAFVIINAGFCDIYNAIQDGRDLLPVLEKIEGLTRRMVQQARTHEVVPIVTTLTPVRGRFLLPHQRLIEYSTRNKAAENSAYREMNRRLAALSASERIPLIDFHEALCDEDGFLARAYALPDGEHIHLDGYRHLTGFLQNELQRIFPGAAQDP